MPKPYGFCFYASRRKTAEYIQKFFSVLGQNSITKSAQSPYTKYMYMYAYIWEEKTPNSKTNAKYRILNSELDLLART